MLLQNLQIDFVFLYIKYVFDKLLFYLLLKTMKLIVVIVGDVREGMVMEFCDMGWV